MDTLWMTLRVAVSLGVVLALMWVLHRRATKGGLGAAKARGRRSAAVEVVGRQGLGGKASVVVVDVEGERLVLGVSEQSVSLLRSGPTPAPELTIVTGPVVLPTEPRTPAPATTADRFRAELERQEHATTGLPADMPAERATDAVTGTTATPLPMRPRGSARRPARAVVPTAQQLQGSVLSADTWRQAAAALRGRRAG